MNVLEIADADILVQLDDLHRLLDDVLRVCYGDSLLNWHGIDQRRLGSHRQLSARRNQQWFAGRQIGTCEGQYSQDQQLLHLPLSL